MTQPSSIPAERIRDALKRLEKQETISVMATEPAALNQK
jgi:hypothetical protein